RDALQTEAEGLWLHDSKVSPCRLEVPWGQRSPLSLECVFVGPSWCQPWLAGSKGTFP
ncbi:unnamed protein product, partial [Coccothraustes coccothraustes]